MLPIEWACVIVGCVPNYWETGTNLGGNAPVLAHSLGRSLIVVAIARGQELWYPFLEGANAG